MMTRSVFLDQSKFSTFQAHRLQKSLHRCWECALRVSYPFAHQAVVEWQAYEVEGRLLDEVGIEDSDLRWLPGNVVCHRLPEPLSTPLRKQRSS